MDDNFFVKAHEGSKKWPIDTRGEKLECHVTASHPETGLNLQVLSTEVCNPTSIFPFVHEGLVGGLQEEQLLINEIAILSILHRYLRQCSRDHERHWRESPS